MNDSASRAFVGESVSPVPRYALYGEPGSDSGERPISILPLKEKLKPCHNVIDPHIHPNFEQLVIVQRGGGTMMIEGSNWKFRDPAILIVPSLSVHGFAYEAEADGWVVTVAKSYFQEITTRAPEFSEIFNVGGCVEFLHQEAAYLELERVIGKLEWEQRRSARCREIATEALLIDLLVGVLRKLQFAESPQVAESGSYQDAYRRFIGMVEEHHRENWSLQRFAEALGTSVPRLRAVCRTVSGESPIRIINRRIALEAKRCLTYTSMSVSEIAYRLGFEDPSYFSRFFKSRCEQTPMQYRAAKQNARRVFDSGSVT